VLAHQRTGGTPVIVQQPVIERAVSPWPFVVGFGALLALVLVGWAVLRRQRRRTEQAIRDLKEETYEYASRNVEHMDEHPWHAIKDAPRRPSAQAMGATPPPPYDPQRPPRTIRRQVETQVINPPVVVPPPVVYPAGPTFTDGLILGSVLDHHRDRETVVIRERTPEPVRHSHHDADYGGGSSSWSSSDSSSYSSGGGGSDFGGGGDFSGGGGGGDF
jgi:uncharacterized membrane protein YgcG